MQRCINALAVVVTALSTTFSAQTVSLSGTVTDNGGTPVSGAFLELLGQSILVQTDSAGRFVFSQDANPIVSGFENGRIGSVSFANGHVIARCAVAGSLGIEVYNSRGVLLSNRSLQTPQGVSAVDVGAGQFGAGLLLIRVTQNGTVKTFKCSSNGSGTSGAAFSSPALPGVAALSRSAAAAVDSIRCVRAGYDTLVVPVTAYIDSELTIVMTPAASAPQITAQRSLSCPEDSFLTISAADFTIIDADGDNSFVIAATPGNNYTLDGLKIIPAANFYGVLTVPVTAKDAALSASAPYNVSITVAPVNDVPVVSAIGDTTVQVGRAITRALSVSDVDDSAFSVTVIGQPSAPISYDPSTGMITFTADRELFDPSQLLTYNLAISDGDAADSVSWTITTSAHVWDNLGILDANISRFTALSSTVLFVVDSANREVTKFTVNGTTATNVSAYSFAAEYTPLQMAVVNDSLLVYAAKSRYQNYPYTGIASFPLASFPAGAGIVDDTVHGSYNRVAWSAGMNGQLRAYLNPNTGSTLADHHTGADVTLETFANDLAVAKSGGTAFCVLNGPFVYRKIGFNATWTKAKEPGASFNTTFSRVVPADSLGNLVYLIDNAAGLWRVNDGRHDFTPVSLAGFSPTLALCAASSYSLWRIDGSGNVKFSRNGFVSEYRENLAAGSIKEIVRSVDNAAIFAIGNDGTIYRY